MMGKRSVVTDEMLKALREAHRNGETVTSVGKRFNIRHQTLFYWTKKMGLKFKRSRPSLETRKKMSESHKGKRGPRGPLEKTLLREVAIINDYLQDKNQSWEQLAEKHHVSETKARTIIGQHLITVCRADEKCPWKPLLPEYREAVK